MNQITKYIRKQRLYTLATLLVLIVFSCSQEETRRDFLLMKYRFDAISNLSLDTVYSENDTIFLSYTDHSDYYDPFSIDEQFLYLLMLNEDCLQDRIISYTICVEGNSEIEPSILKGHCSYQQIISTSAYNAFTKNIFYRQVLKQLYSSKYYPYHLLMLNWNYGYELSVIKDPNRYYCANSTELIRNFIVNKSLHNPTIDRMWYNVFDKEMKIKSVDPEFDKEKKELLISITNYRRRSNM